MIDDDDPRIAETHAALDAYWRGVGPVDADVISYLINPSFMGGPSWPNLRQAYRVVRPEGALIIASDGLSDPFVGTDREHENGFDMEVFLETPDLVGADFQALRDSWAFAAVRNFADNVAAWGGIAPQLRRMGLISTELPIADAFPAGWRTDRGTVGFLLNLPAEGRAMEIAETPFAPVMIVALTLLTPAETARILERGDQGRAEIAEALRAAGIGHRASLARASVI